MADCNEGMSANYSFEVLNSFDALSPAMDNLSLWLEKQQTPQAAAYLALLALEELVTNCIKYGYDDSAQHAIQVSVQLSEGGMILVVEDDGHPFNPLEQVGPDMTLPLEKRPIGGLGIHMLRKMSDRMEYAREGGRNRVTLHKANQP